MDERSFFTAYPHLPDLLRIEPPLAELGPGEPIDVMRPRLVAALNFPALFAGQKVRR